MNRPEDELVEKCIRLLEKNYNVFTEVGMYGYYADIVCIDEKGEIQAIECKINNPKQAIKQAQRYKRFSDYSIILLPKKNYSKHILEQCKVLGLGFWQYDKSNNIIDCVIDAIWNEDQSLAFKNEIIRKLKLRG